MQSSAHIQIVGGDNCIPVAQQKRAPIKVGSSLGIGVGAIVGDGDGGGIGGIRIIQKFGEHI